MTDERENEIMNEAFTILSMAPFHYQLSIEYPGFLLIKFEDEDEPDGYRYYAAGFANPTLTVHRDHPDGRPAEASVDTRVPCVTLDGWRMAILIVAAIDRLRAVP
jgi:hypothetical protein